MLALWQKARRRNYELARRRWDENSIDAIRIRGDFLDEFYRLSKLKKHGP
jgi:hypothetical protein